MFQNKIIKQIIYVLLFIGLLSFRQISEDYIIKMVHAGTIDITIHLLYLTIYPVILGVYLGLPSLLLLSRKTGVWRFDYINFFIIVFPLLLLSWIPFLYYKTIFGQLNFLGFIVAKLFMKDHAGSLIILGISLGLTLTLCFKKNEERY